MSNIEKIYQEHLKDLQSTWDKEDIDHNNYSNNGAITEHRNIEVRK